jgi:hypothetical protein
MLEDLTREHYAAWWMGEKVFKLTSGRLERFQWQGSSVF